MKLVSVNRQATVLGEEVALVTVQCQPSEVVELDAWMLSRRKQALEQLTAQAEELGLYGLPAEAQDLAIPEPHPLAVRTFDNAMDTDGEDAPCVGSVCRSE